MNRVVFFWFFVCWNGGHMLCSMCVVCGTPGTTHAQIIPVEDRR